MVSLTRFSLCLSCQQDYCNLGQVSELCALSLSDSLYLSFHSGFSHPSPLLRPLFLSAGCQCLIPDVLDVALRPPGDPASPLVSFCYFFSYLCVCVLNLFVSVIVSS